MVKGNVDIRVTLD